VKNIIFLRHVKSKGNITDFEKGTKFIGRNSDYDITLSNKTTIDSLKDLVSDYTLVFSSPSKRCKQSLELITNKKIIENKKLHEINYGDANELYFKEIQEKYSYLFEGWKRGEDPKFPNGENMQNVSNRYENFINELENYQEDKILICTHNVFLRTVLGNALDISLKDWFKIFVPHFEPLKFELNKGKILYKGSVEQKQRILKNF